MPHLLASNCDQCHVAHFIYATETKGERSLVDVGNPIQIQMLATLMIVTEYSTKRLLVHLIHTLLRFAKIWKEEQHSSDVHYVNFGVFNVGGSF